MSSFHSSVNSDDSSDTANHIKNNPKHKADVKPTQGRNKKPRQWLPTDYKQALDATQRLVCIGLAVWAFVHGNIWESIVILTAGKADLRRANELLVKALKSMMTEE